MGPRCGKGSSDGSGTLLSAERDCKGCSQRQTDVLHAYSQTEARLCQTLETLQPQTNVNTDQDQRAAELQKVETGDS